MTNCLGKSCPFGLLRVLRGLLSIRECASFPFGFYGGMWDLIALVPDQCLFFLLTVITEPLLERCQR